MKYKKREHLNYSAYGICGHLLAVSADSSSLNLFLQSLQKNRHSLNLFELSNFGNPNGSETKKGYKRVRSKNILIKEQRELSQLNEALSC